MAKITKPPPPSTGVVSRPVAPGGGFHAMYGIAIRDDLAKFRNQIGKTIGDTMKAIEHGDPKAKQVRGDGILQGMELKEAKKALKHLQLAQKQLKPVFGELPLTRPENPAPNWRGTGPRPTPPEFIGDSGNVFRAMYGIALRDDLSGLRAQISTTKTNINKAIAAGQFSKTELAEAKKSLKYLDAALADLKPI